MAFTHKSILINHKAKLSGLSLVNVGHHKSLVVSTMGTYRKLYHGLAFIP